METYFGTRLIEARLPRRRRRSLAGRGAQACDYFRGQALARRSSRELRLSRASDHDDDEREASAYLRTAFVKPNSSRVSKFVIPALMVEPLGRTRGCASSAVYLRGRRLDSAPMVICLYGLSSRTDVDPEADADLFSELLAQARSMPGFIGYHVYSSEGGEELGVIRFQTREALDAWRNDLTHRAAWERAREFYTEFWVQNCETFREYVWREGRHIDGSLDDRFRREPANLANAELG